MKKLLLSMAAVAATTLALPAMAHMNTVMLALAESSDSSSSSNAASSVSSSSSSDSSSSVSSSSSSTPSQSSSSVSAIPCLSNAVTVRDNAVITARTSFNASIIAALQTRRDALAAAYLMMDMHSRQAAVKAAWKAYADASAKARAKYKADVKTAWSAFLSAELSCKPQANTNGKAWWKIFGKNKDEHEDMKVKTDGNIHTGKSEAGADMKVDLSL